METKKRIIIDENISRAYGLEFYLKHINEIGKMTPISALTILDSNVYNENEYILYDLFRRNKNMSISCKNYAIARRIDNIAPKGYGHTISLIDDFQNIDRSYIDKNDFHNVGLIIPITYAMWGVKFNDKINVSYSTTVPFNGYIGTEFQNTLSKKTLDEVERIVHIISQEGNFTDVEKVLILSNYLDRKSVV